MLFQSHEKHMRIVAQVFSQVKSQACFKTDNALKYTYRMNKLTQGTTMSAKEILKNICETAISMKRPCAVTQTLEGVSVRLDMLTFTDGIWTIRRGREAFTTSSVFEAETKLNEMLKKVENAA